MADTDSVLASFHEFLSEERAPERSILVVNWRGTEPVRQLLEETFDPLPLEVEEREELEQGENLVVLVEDGEVVATSSVQSLREAVLFVNTDLYRTGLSGIEEYEAPDVLTELDEMSFDLRGLPASTKEKLLLVVMSRFIEKRALEVGEGRLDVAFQKLSRMEDEYGTKQVYELLADTNLDIHVYGVPDATPEPGGFTVHAGESEPYRRSWFVVFDPPAGNEPAALLAVETEPNRWDSIWTYDRDRVEQLQTLIRSGFSSAAHE